MANLYGADILDPVFIHCMIMMMMTVVHLKALCKARP